MHESRDESRLDSSIERRALKEHFNQELVQKANEKKIPLTSERCIIFPFDKTKLRYLRDTYRKILVKDVCTPEKITQVITDIEAACDNFKEHQFYRKTIRITLALGSLGLIVGIFLIVLGMIMFHSTPAGSQSIHKSGLHINTVIGMIVTSCSAVIIYIVLLTVGHKTKDLNAMYVAKYDKVLASYRSTFKSYQMRWRIGIDRLWLELWLDFNKAITGLSDYESTSNILSPGDSLENSRKTSFEETKNDINFAEDSKEDDESVKQKGVPSRVPYNRQKEKKEGKVRAFSKFEIAAARSLFQKGTKDKKE